MTKFIYLVTIFFMLFSCSKKELVKLSRDNKKKIEQSVKKQVDLNNYTKKATENYLIALEYKQRGYYRNSIEYLKRTLKFEKNYYLYYLLSTCYLRIDSIDTAIKYDDLAFQLNPNDEDVLLNRVNLLVKKRDMMAALKLTNKLLDINEKNYNYSKLKISLLRYLKEYDKAYKLIDKLLLNDIDLKLRKNIYILKIGVAKAEGNLELVEKIYNEYLDKYDGKDQEFLFSLAYFYFKNKNKSKTLEIHKRIYDMKPTENIYVLSYAEILKFYGQEEKSISILQENIATKSDNYDFKFLLANIYASRFEFKKAEKIFSKLLQNSKTSVEFFNSFGNMYLNNGEFKKASQIFLKAVDKFPNDISLLNNCAYSLSEAEIDLDKALGFSKKTLESEPHSIFYLDTYGWILYKMGDFENAEKAVMKALIFNKENSQLDIILEHLGDIYVKMKRNMKALKYYKDAFELTKNIRLKNKIESLEKYEK